MDKRYANFITAVFLVAGRGTRISKLTNNPKCLLKINNQSLITSNIKKLIHFGIKNFVIVTGFKKKLIIDHLKMYEKNKKINIKYIDNKFYISKGNSYSLLLGLKNVKSRQCIFLDGDVVIKSEILKKFIYFNKKNSALVGKGSVKDVECAKVFINKKKKIRYMIDKVLAGKEILKNHFFLGEAIGLIKLNKKYRERLISVLNLFLSKKKNYKKNWEKPLNEFMKNFNLDYLYTNSQKWIEIDDKKDYETAKKIFR